MRYLTVYINPHTGQECIGTGADKQCFHEYASADNVIRFGIRKPIFPAGQYNIYHWPEGTTSVTFEKTAYKQA